MLFTSSVSVRQLAEQIAAEVFGDPDLVVKGMNDVNLATVDELILADKEPYYRLALLSKALVVLVPANINEVRFVSAGKTVVKSGHPHRAFQQIARMFSPTVPGSIGIDPMARIDPTAVLGERCSVGPFSEVAASVSIGADTVIGSNVIVEHGCRIGRECRIESRTTLHRGTTIGDGCVVGSGCTVGSRAFYAFEEDGQLVGGDSYGTVTLGECVELGAGCTVDRGTFGTTAIGDNSKLDNQIHVGHDAWIGSRVRIAAQSGIAGYSRVGNDVVIRGQVGIMHRISVGDRVIVLGKSGVDRNVSDNQVVFGIPARTRRDEMQRRRVLLRRVRRLEKNYGSSSPDQDVEKRVCRILADEAGIEGSKVALTLDLEKDLSFDSLDRSSLLTVLEDEFDSELLELRFSESSFDNVRTVAQVVEAVKAHLNVRR